MAGAGVVAAHHPRHAPQPSLDHGVVQRAEGASVETAQGVVDVLVGEAGYQMVDLFGDARLLTIGEVINPHLDDLFGDLQGAMLVELDVSGPLDARFGRSGD